MDIRALVYRNTLGDTSNGGVSERFDGLTIVEDPYADDLPIDAVKMIERKVHLGQAEPTVFNIIVPVDAGEDGRPYMFGGNFAWSSDARFPSKTPLKIFDRKE